MKKAAKVYLVGAGPGPVGLLTLRGKEVLERAEVVVYDRLVGNEVLMLIPATAEKIYVGKNVNNHPVPQWEINQILLTQAKLGKQVVRLKGGDSFVFGRGGEELEVLAAADIGFEVVPGITSAIAAATYAGIPVTHRDYCSSLHIITGHKKENGELDLNFRALVQLEGTLVFLMAVANITEISEGLIAHGMERDLSCAVIENGTRGQQRKFVSSIAKIGQLVKEEKIISPAIFVVGKVCNLSEKFNWFEQLPLKGKKILVTRPQATSGKLAVQLTELGAEVEILPCIVTKELEFSLPPLDRYSWLVFTSAAGVAGFFNQLFKLKLDGRALTGKKLAVVGRETGKALQNYGLLADLVPEVFDGKHLAEKLLANSEQEENFLLVRPMEGAGEIVEVLQAAKRSFTELIVYKTEIITHPLIKFESYDYITFTSASCVRGFVGTDQQDFSQLKAICIGKQTAEMARSYGMQVFIAAEASLESMIERICEMANDN